MEIKEVLTIFGIFVASFLGVIRIRIALKPESKIKRLYKKVLGRKVDQSGLEHYLFQYKNGQKNMERIRDEIAKSLESMENIRRAYFDYLRRTPETTGMEHHVNLLATGQQTIKQIRHGIKNSKEARSLK